MWVRGHSRSLKVVPFESLCAVSYSPSIVTMAVSVSVCKIFSVKEWCDLKNRVRVRSRSPKMAPFDRSHTIVFLFIFHTNYDAILYHLRDVASYWSKIAQNFYTPPVFSAPQGVTPSEFCEKFNAGKTRMIGLPYGEKTMTIC